MSFSRLVYLAGLQVWAVPLSAWDGVWGGGILVSGS